MRERRSSVLSLISDLPQSRSTARIQTRCDPPPQLSAAPVFPDIRESHELFRHHAPTSEAAMTDVLAAECPTDFDHPSGDVGFRSASPAFRRRHHPFKSAFL